MRHAHIDVNTRRLALFDERTLTADYLVHAVTDHGCEPLIQSGRSPSSPMSRTSTRTMAAGIWSKRHAARAGAVSNDGSAGSPWRSRAGPGNGGPVRPAPGSAARWR